MKNIIFIILFCFYKPVLFYIERFKVLKKKILILYDHLVPLLVFQVYEW